MRPELAQSFGSVADDARGRPGWPLAAIDAVGLPREARVLDLAAGTGKLTEALAARFDHVVAHLMSQSQVASRPDAERAAIGRELQRLVPEGRHVRPLRCEVY